MTRPDSGWGAHALRVPRGFATDFLWWTYRVGQKSKMLILSEYIKNWEDRNVNKKEQLQRKWSRPIVRYFHVKYFTSQLFYVSIFYDWKQSMKLLLGKHELADVNMTL